MITALFMIYFLVGVGFFLTKILKRFWALALEGYDLEDILLHYIRLKEDNESHALVEYAAIYFLLSIVWPIYFLGRFSYKLLEKLRASIVAEKERKELVEMMMQDETFRKKFDIDSNKWRKKEDWEL